MDEVTGPAPTSLSDSMRRDFAVVIPAFDEAPVIPDLIRELRATFEAHGLAGEVILVDDGSGDGTAEVAHEEADGWEPLVVLRHRLNLGKTEAMVTAAAHTDRTYVVLFDADLQHGTEEIPRTTRWRCPPFTTASRGGSSGSRSPT
jgi:glycosyltransferase involved in cell wall biosynthesis